MYNLINIILYDIIYIYIIYNLYSIICDIIYTSMAGTGNFVLTKMQNAR